MKKILRKLSRLIGEGSEGKFENRYKVRNTRPSLVAQLVKNLPAMQETPVRFLGREDPLEKGMATHSSILAWRIPWTEEPGGLQSFDCSLGVA